MSREQLSEHEAEGAGPAQAEQQGDIQGLPPNLYHQASRIRPGDAQGLRDLLTLFPDFAPQILAVASPVAGLSTVKQAQAMVQQNAVGRGGALTSQQIHPGGEFALEGSAPVAGPAPEEQAAATAPLSKPEQAAVLHDESDPKALSKPEQAEVLNDRSDPFYMTEGSLLSPTKGEDARAFNDGHVHLVASFHTLTNHACRDERGYANAQLVASWQAARGLDVDGKIGPHTLAAAKAESKSQTEVAAGQGGPEHGSGIPV